MSDERTEAPTPKRRVEVRQRGQTARSNDLTAAIVLLADLYGLKTLAAPVQGKLGGLLVGNILAAGAIDKSAPPSMGTNVLAVLTETLPPLLGIMACAAMAASVLQGGFLFAPGLLSPKLERVNPIAGTKKLLSIQGLIQTARSLAKFAILATVSTVVIRSRLADLAALGRLELLPSVRMLVSLVWQILFSSALAMVGLGLLDFLWTRRQFLQQLRMTKQETKEESRRSDGDPLVRGQQRRRREAFHQKMMAAVKTADVVVTNPTHYAVALKYDPETMAAPLVVAKGQDFLALRIREAAAEARVPVLENPPLARALHKLVPLGRAIPAELYLAVAEVLAFVFRLRTEREAAGV